MQTARLLLALLVSALTALAADAPAFPSELRLASGATLRRCVVVRWTSDTVVVRHAGGVDPIRFANIAADQRPAVEAVRKAAIAADEAAAAKAIADATAPRTYSGQAFVVTQGAGNYKLGAMAIYVFPMARWTNTSTGKWELGKPIARATTDAEGLFSFTVNGDEPFFLYATASRVISLRKTEEYLWLVKSVDIKDRKALHLTNTNLTEEHIIPVRMDLSD